MFHTMQFHTMMLCDDNRAAVAAPIDETLASGELSHPLEHYWISTSHNSYLQDEDQLAGRSSAHMYRRILLQGCR